MNETDDWVLNRFYQFDIDAFKLTIDERTAALTEIEIDLAKRTDDLITFAATPIHERLLHVNKTEMAARERGEKGDNLGATMARAYLTVNMRSLEPMSEPGARGAAKAMDVSIERRIFAAKFDPIAFDVACSYASFYLDPHIEMPEVVRLFISAVLRGEFKRPSAKRGTKDYTFLARDWTLCEAINVGAQFGLVATRNDVSDGFSGCDVVAQYLSDRGLSPSTFAGVKRIWLARGALNTKFHRTMTGE